MDIKEVASMGGKATVKKRFAGKSKKQVSEFMSNVRSGKKTGLALYSGTVKGLKAILNLKKFIVCPSCKKQMNVEDMDVDFCLMCTKIRFED